MRLLDVFIESKELRKLFVARSEKLNIPLKFMCNEAGVDYPKFMASYMNSSSARNCEVTEEQFIEMLAMVGVSVKYQFIVSDSEQLNISIKDICDKYRSIEETKFNNSKRIKDE